MLLHHCLQTCPVPPVATPSDTSITCVIMLEDLKDKFKAKAAAYWAGYAAHSTGSAAHGLRFCSLKQAYRARNENDSRGPHMRAVLCVVFSQLCMALGLALVRGTQRDTVLGSSTHAL